TYAHYNYLFLSTHPPPPVTYTLSLHDALPISIHRADLIGVHAQPALEAAAPAALERPSEGFGFPEVKPRAVDRVLHAGGARGERSEEHTSELQSRENLVCRLLLEKKNLQ